MKPTRPLLVNLHIPKSAGTSQRIYLFQVYGKEDVFWYGLHSDSCTFDPEEVKSPLVIGGHRQLHFYPKDLTALYTSVIRDPIERVVSYFNYCTADPGTVTNDWRAKRMEELEYWRDAGVDPESIARSIKNSDAFRKEITNLQCAYLSRHGATFDGVRRTMAKENMLIGIFEKLPLYNQFLCQVLQFPIENTAHTNASRSGLDKKLLMKSGVFDMIRSLTAEDQRLYNFVRYEHGGLYEGAANLEAVRNLVPAFESRSNLRNTSTKFDWRKVHLYCKGFLGTNTRETMIIPLLIKNTSNYNVIFSKSDDNTCAIGWILHDSAGVPIEGATGICRLDRKVPSGETKDVILLIEPDSELFKSAQFGVLEFFIVANGVSIRTEYPLSSTWARIHIH